jgi:uncharacterized protein YbbC (DUF1343 family)/CubicO group peptidase (beta-lactamase class C family)
MAQRAAVLRAVLLAALLMAGPGLAQQPSDCGVDRRWLGRIEGHVRAAIARKRLSDAVVTVGCRNEELLRVAAGPVHASAEAEPLYDLASLSKTVATASAAMALVDDRRLSLSDPVGRHLPAFQGKGKDRVTVEMLLRHTAGLPAVCPVDWLRGAPQLVRARVLAAPLQDTPGRHHRYSDVGYLILGWVVEAAAAEPLDQFVHRRVFAPLGMRHTTYRPPVGAQCVPTSVGGSPSACRVHDPRAAALGGVAGHAGLFSTATDIGLFLAAVLDGGRNRSGQSVLQPATVAQMIEARADLPWALGWRFWRDERGWGAAPFPAHSVGHLGFTGTLLWADPDTGLRVVFLASRLAVDQPQRIGDVRNAVLSAVWAARQGPATAGEVGRVQTGIDVVATEGWPRDLTARRVGLLTNPAGRDVHGRPTADVLAAAGLEVAAFFSAEHGLEGARQGGVGDGRSADGRPIYSLFGPRSSPTAEQLRGLDAIVVDLQDAGVRFYTYISTVLSCMRAAAKHGVAVIILDRPNPLGGVRIEGPIPPKGALDFVGPLAVPVVHGMTLGELARLGRVELGLQAANLHVVAMKGWRRDMGYEATGLAWVPPSPNLVGLESTQLYPGLGLLETTNVSVGRGTAKPFVQIAAKWLDPERVLQAIDPAALRGISAQIDPAKRGKRKIWFEIRDQQAASTVQFGVAVALALRKVHAAVWDSRRLDRLLKSPTTLEAVLGRQPLAQITATWQQAERAFRERRKPFLLYPEPP